MLQVQLQRNISKSGSLREAGFSVIEVIVAMMILTVVVSGAVYAVAGAERGGQRIQATADIHEMAEKAFERLNGDVEAFDLCNNSGPQWKRAAERAAVRINNGSTGAVSFGACSIRYNDIVDEQGRTYEVRLNVIPVDAADDGSGANDVDANYRDRYDVSANVRLAANSTDGLEGLTPINVDGRVDWNDGRPTDKGSAVAYVCGFDRPDSAVYGANKCTSSDNAVPVGGITVRLIAQPEPGFSPVSKTARSSSSGQASFDGLLEPGTYKVEVAGLPSAWLLHRIEPEAITVRSSLQQKINVSLIRKPSYTLICGRISPVGKNSPIFDGYEVLRANVSFRRTGSEAYRTSNIKMSSNNSWSCRNYRNRTVYLKDPLLRNTSTFLHPGSYDLEIGQVDRRGNTSYYGLDVAGTPRLGRISSATNVNCNSSSTTGGRIIPRPVDPELDRDPSGDNKPTSGYSEPWYGKYERASTESSPQVICIEFQARQYLLRQCVPDNQYSTCRYTNTTCTPRSTPYGIAPCPAGADLCTANCPSGGGAVTAPAGTVVATETRLNTPIGAGQGPNDQTAACTPQGSRPGSWPGSFRLGVDPANNVAESTWRPLDWLGGDTNYYNNFFGIHAAFDNQRPDFPPSMHRPTAFCDEISFTIGRSALTGPPELCAAGWNGDCGVYPYRAPGRPYRYGDCLEVSIPGRSQVIRGRVLDTTGAHTSTLYMNVNAWRQLVPEATRVVQFWNPFGTAAGTIWATLSGEPDIVIKRIDGDPVCNSGGPPAPIFQHFDPIFDDVYRYPWNDPDIFDPPVLVENGNTGIDSISL